MKESKVGLQRAIGELIKPVKSPIEGFDLVINSAKAYAYIAPRELLAISLPELDRKSFYLPPETEDSALNMDIIAIALMKKFEFKFEFNYFISDIMKSGFIDYWKRTENKKVLGNKYNEFDSEPDVGNHYNSINLDQLQSAFCLYIIVIIFYLLIFSIELFKKYVSYIIFTVNTYIWIGYNYN